MSYRDVNARFVPIEHWPGRPTIKRKSSPFRASWRATLKLLRRELDHLGAKNIVVQVDMDASQIRQDGYLRSDARARGPGVILSFDSKHGPLSYPCDTFTTWEANLRAIALSLENLRAVDRYGVTRRGEQYAGWKKLGSGGTPVQVAMTLHEAAAYMAACAQAGYDADELIGAETAYRDAYRYAAKRTHPDVEGGSVEAVQRLQEAKRVLDKHHYGAK